MAAFSWQPWTIVLSQEIKWLLLPTLKKYIYISSPSAIIMCKFEVLLEQPATVYSRAWSNDLENSPCDC